MADDRLAAGAGLRGTEPPRGPHPLKATYAGEPGTPAAAAWESLLGRHFRDTAVADVRDLRELDLSDTGLLIVDGGTLDDEGALRGRELVPEGLGLEHFPCATVLVGGVGGLTADALGLKLGWRQFGCLCLGGEAIVMEAGHPVLLGPYPVAAGLSSQDHIAPGGQLRVLAEQQSVRGLALSPEGLLDSPETEAVLGGTTDPEGEYLAVARQARFTLWGFSATPDALTDAGRALLLNTLLHTVRHGAEQPLAARLAPPRLVLRAALTDIAGLAGPERADALAGIFGPDGIPAGLLMPDADLPGWYDQHHPWVRWQGTRDRGCFRYDAEAAGTGVPNTETELLRRCLEDLAAGRDTERAARIFTRYTGLPADDPHSLEWFEAHAGELFLSDSGGYRFTAPRAPAPWRAPLFGGASDGQVRSFAYAERHGAAVTAHVCLWPQGGRALHLGAACGAGAPSVAAGPGSGYAVTGQRVFPGRNEDTGTHDGHFFKGICLDLDLDGTGPAAGLRIDVPGCDGQGRSFDCELLMRFDVPEPEV